MGGAGLELDRNGYDEFGGFYDEQGRYVSPFREGADTEQGKAEAEAAAARYRESQAAADAEQDPRASLASLAGYNIYSDVASRRGSDATQSSVLSAGSRSSSRSKKHKSKKKDKERRRDPSSDAGGAGDGDAGLGGGEMAL